MVATTGFHRKVCRADYEATRLYVNFFQPLMVLLEKDYHGVKVRKRYERAKTSYQLVLASPDVGEEVK